jgi:hypothetical protein
MIFLGKFLVANSQKSNPLLHSGKQDTSTFLPTYEQHIKTTKKAPVTSLFRSKTRHMSYLSFKQIKSRLAYNEIVCHYKKLITRQL